MPNHESTRPGREGKAVARAAVSLALVMFMLCTAAIAVTLRTAAARSPLSSPPSQAFHTAAGGPDAFGYTWDDSVPFTWIDARANGAQADLRGDNTASDEISLGFVFPFYENSYSHAYVSTNGMLTLGSPSLAAANLPLPSPFAPGNLIAPFWDNLCVDCENLNIGKVFYQRGGGAPNRYFVAEWWEVSRIDAIYRLTFEVVLYENGDILFQYGPLIGDVEQCTVGIQNATGSDGLLYLYREPGLAEGKAIKFIRPPDQARVGLYPSSQGQLGMAGQVLSYTLQIQNLGDRGTDTFDLYATSDWPVQFYDASGTAPLVDTDADGLVDSGPLPSAETLVLAVRVTIPSEANVGDWELATLTATSSNDPSHSRSATIASAVPPAFAQVYTEGWDPYGALDGEAYLRVFHPEGAATAQLTLDHKPEAIASVVRAPDGRLIAAWDRTFWNRRGHYSSDIQYAILDLASGQVTTRQGTDRTYSARPVLESAPSLAAAPNGNVALAWTRRLPSSWPPGVVDPARWDVLYAVHSDRGQAVTLPTNLSRNANDYSVYNPTNGTARDYAPVIAVTDDSRFALAWQRERYDAGYFNDVYYAILDANGRQLQPATALITDTERSSSLGHFDARVLALPGAQAVILWSSGQGIQHAVLDSAGQVTRPPATLIAGLGGDVDLADAALLPNGDLFVAWTRDQELAYAIINSNFETVLPATLLHNPWSDANYAVSVRPIPQGQVVLTWQDGDGSALYYALLASDGQVVTPPMPFTTAHEDWIAVSSQGYGLAATDWAYVEPTPTPPPAGWAPRTVLAELFSTTYGTYGAAAENRLISMVNEHGLSELSLLQYFFSLAPSGVGNEQSDRRGIWYGVFWPPAIFFDGMDQWVLPAEDPTDIRIQKQLRGMFELEHQRPSPLAISLAAYPGQSAETGENALLWTATLEALTDTLPSDLMLRCFVYEDPVTYVEEEQTKQARFVVRGLAHEEPVAPILHTVQHLQGEVVLAPGWIGSRLGMVALVQDETTGEVLQAAASSSAPLVTPTPTPREPMVEATLQNGLPYSGSVAYEGAADTYVNSYEPYRNFDGEGRLRVKGDGAQASLIRFELPEYIQGHMVYYATLQVYNRYQESSQPCEVGVYRMRRPWVADEATWYNAADGEEWSYQGAGGPKGPGPDDVDAEPLDWRSVSQANQWFTFNVTEAVRDWAFGDPNYGLLLKGGTSGAVEIYFDSNDTLEHQQPYRPKLFIRYGEAVAPPTPTPTATPTTTPTRLPATATPTPSPTPTGPTPTPTATPVMVILQQEVSPDSSYAGTMDTYISEEHPLDSFATSPLRVKGDGRHTALLRFELPEWLIGQNIHYAGLELQTIRRDKPMNVDIGAYQVLRPWVDVEANWVLAAADQAWGLPGAASAGDSSPIALDVATVRSADAPYRFDVTNAVRWWAHDPQTNHGLLLKGTRNVAVTYDFASSEYTQQKGYRPRLLISYSEAPATPTPTATATWTATPTASPSPTGTLETPSPTVSPTGGSWRCYLPIVVKTHLGER